MAQASPSFQVREASTESDIQSFAAIMQQFQRFLNADFGLDLAFQKFEQEVANLPGAYGPPAGKILLVLATSQDGSTSVVGGIALRPFSSTHVHDPAIAVVDWTVPTCELKRLYVSPTWKGYGLGQLLVESAVTAAQSLGYQKVVLDTLAGLKAANSIYRKLGFTLCSSYNGNPLPDVCFWEKLLPVENRKSVMPHSP